MGTVEHPRVRPGVLEDRLYQEHIVEQAPSLATPSSSCRRDSARPRSRCASWPSTCCASRPDRSCSWPRRGRSSSSTRRAWPRRSSSPPPLVLTGTISAGTASGSPETPPGDRRDPPGGGERPGARRLSPRPPLPDRRRRGPPGRRGLSVRGHRPGQRSGPEGPGARHDRLAGLPDGADPRGLGEPRDRARRVPGRPTIPTCHRTSTASAWRPSRSPCPPRCSTWRSGSGPPSDTRPIAWSTSTSSRRGRRQARAP